MHGSSRVGTITLRDATFSSSQRYQLLFRSLCREGRPLAFPCDAQGTVVLDALGERQRYAYFFARAVIGREYAFPVVVAVDAA